MMCDASEMLAAALEQMDGIIAGSKAMNYTNGLFDCQSPTSPFLGSLRVLHLLEDLRAALDLMDPGEKESLRSQVSETTAEGLIEWLQGQLTNGHGSAAGDLVYQERLSRVESDKECLVLQVSVLTDQVKVQGEKIRDLDSSLEEHRMKLNATEELLQQELLSRSVLETEKLELLTEVSSLKLKLAAAEGDCRESEGLYQDVKEMRLQLTSMEDERQEYDRSLNSTKVRVPHGQEERISLQKQLEEREQALRSLQDQAMPEAPKTEQSQSREKDLEVQRMRRAAESLKAANEEKDLKIKELQQSLIRYKQVQDMVISVQASKASEMKYAYFLAICWKIHPKDDLLGLKVGSVLHHLSIKRAIQVLRINRYDPNCLRRRPIENNPTPAEICQWTNHRVMEWLRSVDLAEYAPNLRGSGVHGGLMILEPRFNVETMALLLNIPPNKTLLRRHLANNFHLLIGSEAQRLKQEYLENPEYTVLTATAKVKPRRLSFGSFGTLRRKRQEEMEEYVCPMDVQMPQSSSFHEALCIYEDSLDQLEQMGDSEGTVRQIGAFSEGINNLTSMLKEDEFFREASSRSPETSATDDD
ncbi:liprin-beta-1-like [Sinocyclocheilus grahami]|nr:PREDICTED: liprin-beta-1-like [Sinocyclocheilus grahami]